MDQIYFSLNLKQLTGFVKRTRVAFLKSIHTAVNACVLLAFLMLLSKTSISSGGDIDNPGKNPHVAGAPTIVINIATTTNLLDGNATSSPASPFAVSGVIDDPTDPAKFSGIDFTISDDETAVDNLIVTVASSNTTVVPVANLSLTGSGASRNLKITPAAVGYSSITITVNDGTYNTSYVISYAASAASVNTSATRFHTGAADASTAQMIDANYMLVADDEDQVLRLYDRQNSGLPLKSFDYTSSLGLTDLSGGVPREIDIESSVRVGNRIYWLTSHSNSSGGGIRVNRYRLFATDVSGSGINTSLSYVGRYDGLRTDLLSWDANDTHGFGANYFGLVASAASGVAPEIEDGSGFNIEGIVMAPDNVTAYICFRAPILPTESRSRALIVPLTSLASLISGNPSAGPALFGEPIELYLEGLGIREIKKNTSGQYLIIAGPQDGSDYFRLYTWTGNANDVPEARSADLSLLNANGSFESIVDVPDPLNSSSQIQLLVDNGDFVYYNDGIIAKDLPDNNHKKFRSEIVRLGAAFCNGGPLNYPDNIYVGAEAGKCGATVNYAVTINCPEVTVSYSQPPGSFFATGTTTIIVTATDADGNITERSFSITVIDEELPVISCQGNIEKSAGSNCSKAVTTTNPVFSDNCQIERLVWTMTGATEGESPLEGINYVGTKTFNAGVTTVAYTVTDIWGNESICSFDVTVKENVSPVISCPMDKIVNTDPDQCYATNVDLGNPNASDNCGIVTVTNNAPSQFPKGITYVKWTVTDNSGNKKTCTQKITVLDKQDPVISCPDNIEVVTNNCSTGITVPAPTFSDNCGVVKLTWTMTGATSRSSSSQGINYVGTKTFNAGTTTITYTAKDAAGNTKTCSFTVTVIDNIAPTINSPQNIQANACGNYCGTYVCTPYPWITDNCSVSGVTWSITGATEASSSAGCGVSYVGTKWFNVGVSTVTYTVKDRAGNTASSSFTVTVKDAKAPYINAPSDKTVFAVSGQCYATNVNLGNPYASDNCGIASITNDAPVQFPVGITYVKWTATDNSGNKSIDIQKVKVLDTQYPVVNCPADQTYCKTSNNQYDVPAMTASDNCGISSIQYTVRGATYRNGYGVNASGYFGQGTSYITWTVKDNSGNISTCVTKIKVNNCTDGYRGAPVTDNSELRTEKLDVMAYPNPTQHFFNVKITSSNSNDPVVIKVFDMNGKVVHQQNGSAGQVYRLGDQLMIGLYLVEVRKGDKIVTTKVVKQ